MLAAVGVSSTPPEKSVATAVDITLYETAPVAAVPQFEFVLAA